MEPAVPNGAAAEAQVPAESAIREQDRLMPFANVMRIMRRVLPPHAKISDDAKEMIQECVSEFISFVTGEANDRCHSEHRKTVTAEDLVWAMNRLGFDNYVMPLSVYLRRMRESEGGGRGPTLPDPAGPKAPQAPAPPEAAIHGVQIQMQQAMYAPPDLAQAYTVAMPLPAIAPHPHVSGQYELFSGERSMAAYYGGGAYVAGSIRGDSADEASSLNAAPAPAMGTGSQTQ